MLNKYHLLNIRIVDVWTFRCYLFFYCALSVQAVLGQL